MKNLIEITSNCFIVKTQAGFNKLLNLYHCAKRNITSEKPYTFRVTNQSPKSEDTYYLGKFGNSEKIIDIPYQYPVKYPCLISIQDERYEQDTIFLGIAYFSKDVTEIMINEIDNNK